MQRFPAALCCAVLLSASASAHHGFGRFDPSREVELEGTLTGLDFVNPHSYVYFESVGPDGEVTEMRCEMRAATVLRRSGWSPELFVEGVQIVVTGRPHRDDPSSCYAETLAIGDAPTLERYEQLDDAGGPVERDRPLRLPSGVPNISGDWAQEQYLIARPPDGGRGGLVPKSLVEAVESGELAAADAPDAGWGPRPVTLTEAGREAADAVRELPSDRVPRLNCEITSILFDWVFDGPINRITQAEDVITIEYGRGLTRTVHMNADRHPDDLAPSRGGHSIGRWEGDTLVVDTVGFEPGIVAPPVFHGDKLHVVERFTVDTESWTLTREYTAADPDYFTDAYTGADTMQIADVPYSPDECKELTFVDYAGEDGAGEPGGRTADGAAVEDESPWWKFWD